jgi:hypothetical protein
MDISFSTLTFYLFGYAFLYGGGNSFIGRVALTPTPGCLCPC